MKNILCICLFLIPVFLNAQRVTLDESNGIYLDKENNLIEDHYGKLERISPKLEYAEYLFTDQVFKKCYTGRTIFSPEEQGVIKLDCEESGSGTYTFQGYSTCPGKGCKYRIYVYWRGDKVGDHEVASNQSANITGYLDDLDVDGLSGGTTRDLRIVVYRVCRRYFGYPPSYGWYWTKVYDVSSPIQIVGHGDTYTVRHEYGVHEELVDANCDFTVEASAHQICCNDGYKAVFRLDEFSKTTTSVGTNITLGFKLEKKGIPFSFNLSGSYSYDMSWGEHTIIRQEFTLEAGENECVYPGYQLYGKRIIEEVYQVDCTTGYDLLVEERVDTVVTRIIPKVCHKEPANPDLCIDPNQNILIESGSNGNIRADDDCTGYINLSAILGDMDEYSVAISGPDGFISYDPINDGLPMGEYNISIGDECCGHLDMTIYLCKSTTYGEWVLNPETEEYCREIICETCEDDGEGKNQRSKDNIIYTECISPEVGPCTFNESTLLCEYNLLVGSEVIGTVTSIPEVVDEFDDFFGVCTRSYYCDNTFKFSEDQDPEYGDWEYDDFFEECFRTVTCFGVDQSEQEEGTPETIWTYDDFFEECIGIVYCNGDPTDEEVSEDPTVIWEYDDFFNECEGVVVCDETEVDEISKDPEVVSCTYDSFWNWCNLEVTCDGSVIFENNTPISDGVIVYTDDGVDYCEVYCCGEATGVIVPCASLAARPTGEEKEVEAKSFQAVSIAPNPIQDNIVISNLPTNRRIHIAITDAVTTKSIFDKFLLSMTGELKLNLDGVNNGAYIIQVLDQDGRIMYSEKFLKIK